MVPLLAVRQVVREVRSGRPVTLVEERRFAVDDLIVGLGPGNRTSVARDVVEIGLRRLDCRLERVAVGVDLTVDEDSAVGLGVRFAEEDSREHLEAGPRRPGLVCHSGVAGIVDRRHRVDEVRRRFEGGRIDPGVLDDLDVVEEVVDPVDVERHRHVVPSGWAASLTP